MRLDDPSRKMLNHLPMYQVPDGRWLAVIPTVNCEFLLTGDVRLSIMLHVRANAFSLHQWTGGLAAAVGVLARYQAHPENCFTEDFNWRWSSHNPPDVDVSLEDLGLD